MKKLSALFMLIMALLCLTACGKETSDQPEHVVTEATDDVTTEAVTEAPTEEETEPVEIGDGTIRSSLTGKEVSAEVKNTRPVAVMINNIQAAIPQTGIAQADIMYECMVEGTITRLMALYEDYSGLKKIGPVRSARTYYVYLANEWMAIYGHFGQCNFANPYLDHGITDNLNGVKGSGVGVFYRTTDRKAPHNAYTSTEGLDYGIDKQGYLRTIDQQLKRLEPNFADTFGTEYKEHFRFAGDDETITNEGGFAANYVYPGFRYSDSEFTYNEEDGLYYHYQYGKKHIDTIGNTHLAYDNIILQFADKNNIMDTPYLDYHLYGEEGTGYYITKGKAVPITWSKPVEWAPTIYTDADGNQLKINQGKTWISLVPTDCMEYTIIGADEDSNEL